MMPRQTMMDSAAIEQVVAAYKCGMSARQIAEYEWPTTRGDTRRFSERTIRRVLVDNGVVLRSRGGFHYKRKEVTR